MTIYWYGEVLGLNHACVSLELVRILRLHPGSAYNCLRKIRLALSLSGPPGSPPSGSSLVRSVHQAAPVFRYAITYRPRAPVGEVTQTG